MNEDNLFPHSDEAGRLPGAMSNQTPVESDPFYLRTKTPPGAMSNQMQIPSLDRTFTEARKVERNRLVWEAMQSYMVRGFEHSALKKAVDSVDAYLKWRDSI